MGDSLPPYWTPGKGVQYALGGPARVRTPSRLRPPSRHAPSADPAGLLRLPHQSQDRIQVVEALSPGVGRRPEGSLASAPSLASSDRSRPGAGHPPGARHLRLGTPENPRIHE